jgi:hypothetical protein
VSDDRPTVCLAENVIFGDDGDVVPGFFDWFENARQHFKFVIYSTVSVHDLFPRFVTARKNWAEAKGIEILPTVISFAIHKQDAFLTIDSRCMQFRGDWSAWWLNPIRLTGYKSWRDPGADMRCEVADATPTGPASGQYSQDADTGASS